MLLLMDTFLHRGLVKTASAHKLLNPSVETVLLHLLLLCICFAFSLPFWTLCAYAICFFLLKNVFYQKQK